MDFTNGGHGILGSVGKEAHIGGGMVIYDTAHSPLAARRTQGTGMIIFVSCSWRLSCEPHPYNPMVHSHQLTRPRQQDRPVPLSAENVLQ